MKYLQTLVTMFFIGGCGGVQQTSQTFEIADNNNPILGIQVKSGPDHPKLVAVANPSPAYNAGIEKEIGNCLKKIDDNEIKTEQDFVNYIDSMNAGTTITLYFNQCTSQAAKAAKVKVEKQGKRSPDHAYVVTLAHASADQASPVGGQEDGSQSEIVEQNQDTVTDENVATEATSNAVGDNQENINPTSHGNLVLEKIKTHLSDRCGMSNLSVSFARTPGVKEYVGFFTLTNSEANQSATIRFPASVEESVDAIFEDWKRDLAATLAATPNYTWIEVCIPLNS